jgi:hypothetical protein
VTSSVAFRSGACARATPSRRIPLPAAAPRSEVRSKAPHVDYGFGRAILERAQRSVRHEEQRERVEIGARRRFELKQFTREDRDVGEGLLRKKAEDRPQLGDNIRMCRRTWVIVRQAMSRLERPKRYLLAQGARETFGGVGIVGCKPAPIGQRDLGEVPSLRRRQRVSGLAAHEARDLLCPADSPSHLVAHRPRAVTGKTARGDRDRFEAFAAPIDFTG